MVRGTILAAAAASMVKGSHCVAATTGSTVATLMLVLHDTEVHIRFIGLSSILYVLQSMTAIYFVWDCYYCAHCWSCDVYNVRLPSTAPSCVGQRQDEDHVVVR